MPSPTAEPSSPSRQTSPSPSFDNTNDFMQIYVKNVAGETTPLTVRSITTIGDLKLLVPITPSETADSIDPKSLRLIHAGRHLSSPTATLSSLSIPQGSTLHIALPLIGGNDAKEVESGASIPALEPAVASPSIPATPSKPKSATSRKPRCGFKACNQKIQPIVGDCGFCKGKFCAKHRMLESHSCEGLEDCKDEARERNREQLEKERTRPLQAL